METAKQNTTNTSLSAEIVKQIDGLEIYFDLRLNEDKSGEMWNTYDVFDYRLGIDSPTIISFRANKFFSAFNQKRQIEAQLITWLKCVRGNAHS